MKSREGLGIALTAALSTAACGNFEIGADTKGYLASDGYSLDCNFIDDIEKRAGEKFLINKEGGCVGSDTELVVDPAVLGGNKR